MNKKFKMIYDEIFKEERFFDSYNDLFSLPNKLDLNFNAKNDAKDSRNESINCKLSFEENSKGIINSNEVLFNREKSIKEKSLIFRNNNKKYKVKKSIINKEINK